MKILIILILSLSYCLCDKLGFVFESVRHGARAPVLPDPFSKFPVTFGELTP